MPSVPDWSPWVYIRLKWGKPSDDGLGILLTINFNKHHLKILGGRIWFGLLGGELKLEPINAEIPYEHRWPETPLVVKTEIRHKSGKTSGSKETRSSSREFNAEGNLADATASGGFSRTKGFENERLNSLEDEYVHIHISTKGSEKEAIWDFEVSEGNLCLQGNLIEKEISKLVVHNEPYAVHASFRVFKKDIRPLSAEGIWRPEDLGSTKKIKKIKKSILLALLRKEIAKMNPVIHSFRLEQSN